MFKPRGGGRKTFFTARGLVGPRKESDEYTEESTSYRKSRNDALHSLHSDSFSSSSSEEPDLGSTPSDEGSQDSPTVFMSSTDEEDLASQMNMGCVDSLFFPGPREPKDSMFQLGKSDADAIESKMMPFALALLSPRSQLESTIANLNCKGPKRECGPESGQHEQDVDDDVFDMDPDKHLPHFFKSLMSLSDGSSDDCDESDPSGLALAARPPALYLTNPAPQVPQNQVPDFPAIQTLPSQIVVQEQPSYGGDSILSFEMIPLGELSIRPSASQSRAPGATSSVSSQQRQQYLGMNYGSALLSVDSDESNPAQTDSLGFDDETRETEQQSEKENDGKADTHDEVQKYSITSPRKSTRESLFPLSMVEDTRTATEDKTMLSPRSKLVKTEDPVKNNNSSRTTLPYGTRAASSLLKNEPIGNTMMPNPWIGSSNHAFAQTDEVYPSFDEGMYPSFDEGPSRKKQDVAPPAPKVLTEENGRNSLLGSPTNSRFQPRPSPKAEILKEKRTEPPRVVSPRVVSPRVVSPRVRASPRSRMPPISSPGGVEEANVSDTPKSLSSMRSPRQGSASPRVNASCDVKNQPMKSPTASPALLANRGNRFNFYSADMPENESSTPAASTSLHAPSKISIGRSPINGLGDMGLNDAAPPPSGGDEIMMLRSPRMADNGDNTGFKDPASNRQAQEGDELMGPSPKTELMDKNSGCDTEEFASANGSPRNIDNPSDTADVSVVVEDESQRGESEPQITSLEELLNSLSDENKTKPHCGPSFDEQTMLTTRTAATQFFEAQMA